MPDPQVMRYNPEAEKEFLMSLSIDAQVSDKDKRVIFPSIYDSKGGYI